MIVLPYREHGFVRFLSTRTGEILFELKMISGAMIIWGQHYRPDEFTASLVESTVTLAGTYLTHGWQWYV